MSFSEKSYQLMCNMFPDIDDMDSSIKKADDSADVRVDKYEEAIEANNNADVPIDKYNETIGVNNSADVRVDKYNETIGVNTSADVR